MANFKNVSTSWTTIFSDNTASNGDFNAVTGYLPAADVDFLRCTFEVQNSTDASGIIKPGIQTANVENAPDSAATITSVNTQTGDGTSYATDIFDVSATTSSKQLVRLGFWFLASSGGFKGARVQARWSIKGNCTLRQFADCSILATAKSRNPRTAM